METQKEQDPVRPQRWDSPFDQALAGSANEGELADVLERILSAPVFSGIDTSRFPAHLSLDGILTNDARLLRKDQNQIIVREGDYGNSAFVILRGSVKLIADRLPGKALGRGSRKKRGPLAMLAQALKGRNIPESRVHHTRRFEGANGGESDAPSVFLQDVPRILEGKATVDIGEGELFGEIAALGRTPRTATVISAEDDTEILEIRWQGLRDLMNFAPQFKNNVEDRFRRYGLSSLLRSLEYVQHLSQDELQILTNETQFERHGRFDWYGTYQQMLSSASARDRLRSEPLIINEGDYLNGLLIVRGGFVRVSRTHHSGEVTKAYLGKGQTYGLSELREHMGGANGDLVSKHTLRAIGYVDLLVIPTHRAEELILSKLGPEEVAQFDTFGVNGHDGDGADDSAGLGKAASRDRLGPGVLEFLMDKRTVNGSAAMLIDLDRCTRCDDCVRACASTHDGNPRFIRYGDRDRSIQVTQACLHCHDPICMIPCPTGAIHREEGGEVVINDNTCIGCSACADNCPYDNIQMVEIRDEKGMPQFPSRDSGSKGPIDVTAHGTLRRATKCDLCYDQLAGPACVRACPHDALERFDMQNVRALDRWLSR
ncbi:cyclic nucleotide-binding domain-containing protein [Haloferula sp.]|uniref:cyclic nucleotide-binding domain-containing protein n=1 Tax=Haloferula sp. TaxID=2497595 RepID=UPI00329BB4BF